MYVSMFMCYTHFQLSHIINTLPFMSSDITLGMKMLGGGIAEFV
jgi:hypothetical protein